MLLDSTSNQTIRNYANEVVRAKARIASHVRYTYLEYSHYLSALGHARVYLKTEYLQHTGSFKLRGAMNKVLSLSPDQLKQGIITASNGNHGIAVCFAAQKVGTVPVVYLRQGASAERLALIESLGGRTVLFGVNPLEAEIKAREVARENGSVFISPYNDKDVIAGQGTIGVELHEQLEDFDAIFIAVGGGGLISGIASYLKIKAPRTRIVGCWPENSRVLYESIKAARIVDFPEGPTLSESTAGGLEPNSITLDLCRSLIDDYVLTSEAEIADALKLIMAEERTIIEGAAAVAVAGYLKERKNYEGKSVVVLLCGRNIEFETLKRIL